MGVPLLHFAEEKTEGQGSFNVLCKATLLVNGKDKI